MPSLSPDRFRDWLLVALAAASGAVDAISWLGLGKVFSAFMTGNLAFLGFRLGGSPQPSAIRTLCSLVGFALGAWIGGRLVGRSRLAGEWPRKVTRALGVSLIPQAVFLIMWLVISGPPAAASADLLIGISALAMGTQTTAVFALGVRASFTTAATATIAVLMGDLSGWTLSQRERLRLASVIAAIIVGALLGTVLFRHARHLAPILPLVIVATVVTIAGLGFGTNGDLEPDLPLGGTRRDPGREDTSTSAPEAHLPQVHA